MLFGASRRAVLLGTAAGIAVAAVLVLLFLAVRWAFGQVTAALAERRGRLVLGAVATLGVVLFALQAAGLFGLDLLGGEWRLFPRPVTQVYARQLRLVAQALTRSVELPPSPDLDASLTRVQGADVFLFFIESYGAVTFEKPEFNARLRSRAHARSRLHDTGRDVFSPRRIADIRRLLWFAHISFLSGIKVADPTWARCDDRAPADGGHQRKARLSHDRRCPGSVPGPGAFAFQDFWRSATRPQVRRLAGGTCRTVHAGQTGRAGIVEGRAAAGVRLLPDGQHTPVTPLAQCERTGRRCCRRGRSPTGNWTRRMSASGYSDLKPACADAVSYAYQTFAECVRQRAGRDYVMI